MELPYSPRRSTRHPSDLHPTSHIPHSSKNSIFTNEAFSPPNYRLSHPSIVVYILTSNNSHVSLLSNLFTDRIFEVKMVNIPAPTGLHASNKMTLDQEIENFRVNNILN